MSTHILGDSHIGRTYIAGVPLHRRGELEASLLAQFIDEVTFPDVDLHVHLGDLFDKAVVSYDLILKAAETYLSVAAQHPNCTYVILRGNHDVYRDLTKRSAFDVFEQLVQSRKNILVVKDKAIRVGDHAFVGYSVERRADEILTDDLKGCHTLFGHYDVDAFGGDGHNLVPTQRAAELGIQTIVTGHVHKPRQFSRDGVDVIVHGSMRPFAHGEESDDSLYVTLSLEDLAAADPKYLRNRCVRVLGVPDEPVDCHQLVIKRPDTEKGDLPKVELGNFDMEALFRETFVEAGVPDNISEQVMLQYQTRRMNDA